MAQRKFHEPLRKLCPQAVFNWIMRGTNPNHPSAFTNADLKMKAKGHLLAKDWKIYYIVKGIGREELRYQAPWGTEYKSLRTACQACQDDDPDPKNVSSSSKSHSVSEPIKNCSSIVSTNSDFDKPWLLEFLMDKGDITRKGIQCRRCCAMIFTIKAHSGEKNIVDGETKFCSENCEKISLGLRNLVGKPIQLSSDESLTGTLFKSTDKNPKVSASLSLIHHCFEPYINPSSPMDVFEGFLFGKKAGTSCVDLRGFYVMVLERENELVAMGAVKIYGRDEAVAESPVVARWSSHRRQIFRELTIHLEKLLLDYCGVKLKMPGIAGVWKNWLKYFRSIPAEEFENIHQLALPVSELLDSKRIFRRQKDFYVMTTKKKTETEDSKDMKLWILQLSAGP